MASFSGAGSMGFGAPVRPGGYPHRFSQTVAGAADSMMEWQNGQTPRPRQTLEPTNDEGRDGIDPDPTKMRIEYHPAEHDNEIVDKLAHVSHMEQSGPRFILEVVRYTGLPWFAHADPRFAPVVSLVDKVEIPYDPQIDSGMTELNASIDMWGPPDLRAKHLKQVSTNLMSGMMKRIEAQLRIEMASTMPPTSVLMAKMAKWEQDVVEMRVFGVLNPSPRRDTFNLFASDTIMLFNAARSIFNIGTSPEPYVLVAPKLPYLKNGALNVTVTKNEMNETTKQPFSLVPVTIKTPGSADILQAMSIESRPRELTTTVQLAGTTAEMVLYGALEDVPHDAWNMQTPMSFFAELPAGAEAVRIESVNHQRRPISAATAAMNSGLFNQPPKMETPFRLFPPLDDKSAATLRDQEWTKSEDYGPRLCRSPGAKLYELECARYLQTVVTKMKPAIKTCDQLTTLIRSFCPLLVETSEFSNSVTATRAAIEFFGGAFQNETYNTLVDTEESNSLVWRNNELSPIMDTKKDIGNMKPLFEINTGKAAEKVESELSKDILAAAKLATLAFPNGRAFTSSTGNLKKRRHAAALLHVWNSWPALLFLYNPTIANITTEDNLRNASMFDTWAKKLYDDISSNEFWKVIFSKNANVSRATAPDVVAAAQTNIGSGFVKPGDRSAFTITDYPSFKTNDSNAVNNMTQALHDIFLPAAPVAAFTATENTAEHVLQVLFDEGAATVAEITTAGSAIFLKLQAGKTEFMGIQRYGTYDPAELEIKEWAIAAILALLPTCQDVFDMFSRYVSGIWIDLRLVFSIVARSMPTFFVPRGCTEWVITNYELRQEERTMFRKQKEFGGYIRYFMMNKRNAAVMLPHSYIHGAEPINGVCPPHKFEVDRSRFGQQNTCFVVTAEIMAGAQQGIAYFAEPEASDDKKKKLWELMGSTLTEHIKQCTRSVPYMGFVPRNIMPMTASMLYANGKEETIVGVGSDSYL